MPLNFSELLSEYGLDTEENSCEVSTAFFHEIHNTIGLNALISSISIELYPSVQDYLVECRIVCQPWTSVEATVDSLAEQWESELRYARSRLSIVDISKESDGAYVKCLSIGRASGISCRFVVASDAAKLAQL